MSDRSFQHTFSRCMIGLLLTISSLTSNAQQVFEENGFELLYTWRETELCLESEFTPIARLEKRQLLRGYGFEPILRFEGRQVFMGRTWKVLCTYDEMQIFKGRTLEVLYTRRDHELCEGLGFYPLFNAEDDSMSMEQWIALLFMNGDLESLDR